MKLLSLFEVDTKKHQGTKNINMGTEKEPKKNGTLQADSSNTTG